MKFEEHKTIFDRGAPERRAFAQRVDDASDDLLANIPEGLLRVESPRLPEVSELQAVRHYTNLSKKNFSIDSQFYPLGSCTMKLNSAICMIPITWYGFANVHPFVPIDQARGN